MTARESVLGDEELPQKCYERHRPRGGLLHNEQFAPFYGNVAFENAPNLHAGSSQAEMRKDRRLRCSLFRSLPLLAFLVFLLSDWWEACATSAAVGGGKSWALGRLTAATIYV